MAYALCGDETDSEDIAQETLIAALENFAGFRGDSKESTWIYGILANKYGTLLRKRRKRLPKKSLSTEPDRDGDIRDAFSYALQ